MTCGRTRPASITIAGTEGPNKGKTFPAIYQLDGDQLRICYDLSGKARPAEFKTRAGTLLYLVTYQRECSTHCHICMRWAAPNLVNVE